MSTQLTQRQVEKAKQWLTAKNYHTAVWGSSIVKTQLRLYYPGGLEAFVRDHPEPVKEESNIKYTPDRLDKIALSKLLTVADKMEDGSVTGRVIDPKSYEQVVAESATTPSALEIVRRIKTMTHDGYSHALTDAECAALVEDYARRDVWQTGIPPVEKGKVRTFWCATKSGAYSALHFAHAFIMPLIHIRGEVPKNAVPVNDDGDYEWTGWIELSCERCDTYGHFTEEVQAWMELPIDFQPTAATGEGSEG